MDFLVVGGICAVLHGAPIATFDLDWVHSRHPDNIQLPMAALEALEGHLALGRFAAAGQRVMTERLSLAERNNPYEQSASVTRLTTAPV